MIIYFTKRKMHKHFICADIKFNTSEIRGLVLLHQKEKRLAEHLKLGKRPRTHEKEEEKKEELFEREEKLFSVTKQKHGCSIIALKNKVFFTLHTTKKFSNIWDLEQENVQIQDDENPIKNVNKIQLMEREDFDKFFKLYHPDRLLTNVRYGKKSIEEMALYSYKAILSSIENSDKIIKFELIDENRAEIKEAMVYLINEKSQVMTPAMVEIGTDIDQSLIEEMRNELLFLENGKLDLVKVIRDNFAGFLNEKY